MPKSVWWFEKLMWLSLLLGVVVAWLDWDRIISEAQEAAGAMPIAVQTVSIFTIVITIAVMLGLVFLIARVRQNWARWVFAVLFVLGLPFVVLKLPADLSANPTAGALSVVQLVMQVTALVLIFVPSARPWFAKRVDARTRQA
jgi:uncharacterized membrane protein